MNLTSSKIRNVSTTLIVGHRMWCSLLISERRTHRRRGVRASVRHLLFLSTFKIFNRALVAIGVNWYAFLRSHRICASVSVKSEYHDGVAGSRILDRDSKAKDIEMWTAIRYMFTGVSNHSLYRVFSIATGIQKLARIRGAIRIET